MKNKIFIVLEGLDRAGKTTICEIVSKLTSDMIKISFPNRESQTGKIIKKNLESNNEYIDPHELHLLFSANRYQESEKINSLLKTNNIICDRYWYSGTCYSVAKGLDFNWCVSVDKFLPKPDIIFFIDIKAEIVNQRKGFGIETNDILNLQRKVYDIYQQLFKNMNDVIRINGNRSLIEIAIDILTYLNTKFKLDVILDTNRITEIINNI